MRLGATRPRADGAVRLMAVPPNVPLVSGALRGDSSPFLRFRLLLGFGPCGAQPDYGSRGWGFESSWAHSDGRLRHHMLATEAEAYESCRNPAQERHSAKPPDYERW